MLRNCCAVVLCGNISHQIINILWRHLLLICGDGFHHHRIKTHTSMQRSENKHHVSECDIIDPLQSYDTLHQQLPPCIHTYTIIPSECIVTATYTSHVQCGHMSISPMHFIFPFRSQAACHFRGIQVVYTMCVFVRAAHYVLYFIQSTHTTPFFASFCV